MLALGMGGIGRPCIRDVFHRTVMNLIEKQIDERIIMNYCTKWLLIYITGKVWRRERERAKGREESIELGLTIEVIDCLCCFSFCFEGIQIQMSYKAN